MKNNNDNFLYDLREEMPREFGETLYRNLIKQEQMPAVQPPRRLPIRLMLSAAVLVLVMFGVVLVAAPYLVVHDTPMAQPTPVTLDMLQPITADNAAQLTEVMTLGNGAVNAAIWSPDGRTIAVATSRGIYLHDSGDLNATPRQITDQNVTSLVYDEAGTRLAGTNNNTIWVWDAEGGEVLHQIETTYSSTQILGIKEQEVAAIHCGESCMMVFHDLTTKEETLSITIPSFQPAILSSDWSFLIYTETKGFQNGELHLIDLSSGDEIATFSGDYLLLNSTLSGDNRTIFIPSFSPQLKLDLYEVEDLRSGNLEPHHSINLRNYPNEVTFHPNNQYILIQGVGGNSDIYDVASGEKIGRLETITWRLRNARFSPDGDTILTIGPGSSIRLWNWQDGTELQRLDSYDELYERVAFNTHSTQIAASPTSWFGGMIRLWNLAANPPVQTVITPEKIDDHTTFMGQFSPQGLLHIQYHDSGYAFLHHGDDKIPFTQAPSDRYIFEAATDGRILRFLPEQKQVIELFVDDAPKIRLDFEHRFSINNNGNYISDFSPDGRLIAGATCLRETGCLRGDIRIWDIETGEMLQILEVGQFQLSKTLIFSTDGNYLASSQCEKLRENPDQFNITCEGEQVLIWKVDTESMSETSTAPFVILEGFEEAPQLAFSPLSTDEQLLLATNDNDTLGLWQIDTATGDYRQLTEVEVLGNNVNISPDGKMIAVAGNGIVQVWGVAR